MVKLNYLIELCKKARPDETPKGCFISPSFGTPLDHNRILESYPLVRKKLSGMFDFSSLDRSRTRKEFAENYDKKGNYFRSKYNESIQLKSTNSKFAYSEFMPQKIVENVLLEKYKKYCLCEEELHICCYERSGSEISEKIILRAKWYHNLLKPGVITIRCICSDAKKEFPLEKGYLGPVNVNSAWTTMNHDSTQIIVFREEEINKVLLHEFIHAAGLDRGLNLNTSLLKFLTNMSVKSYGDEDSQEEKHFNLLSNSRPAEAYTEALAEILNCIMVAFEKDSGDSLKALLEKEISFGFLQSARVLNYFGIEDYFSKTGPQLLQYSNIFNYYIARSALLYDLEGFLDCINNDLTFNSKFPQFFIEAVSSPKFIRELREFQKKKEARVFKSLRMTIIE